MSGKIALTAEEMDQLLRMRDLIETWPPSEVYVIKITKKGNLKVEGIEFDDE